MEKGFRRSARENLLALLHHESAGHGVGLPIVKRTVFDHNGRLILIKPKRHFCQRHAAGHVSFGLGISIFDFRFWI